jgi:3-hydroxymyristoyl/3-hydroxydecanoyl-(acyl carrier protein) dehydratase
MQSQTDPLAELIAKHFQILKSEANKTREFNAVGPIPAGLKYFEGHFPGRPILPAVAVIDISIAVLRRALNSSSLRLDEVKNSKFTSPIIPNSNVSIAFSQESDLSWTVTWSPHMDTTVSTHADSVHGLASLRLSLRN